MKQTKCSGKYLNIRNTSKKFKISQLGGTSYSCDNEIKKATTGYDGAQKESKECGQRRAGRITLYCIMRYRVPLQQCSLLARLLGVSERSKLCSFCRPIKMAYKNYLDTEKDRKSVAWGHTGKECRGIRITAARRKMNKAVGNIRLQA